MLTKESSRGFSEHFSYPVYEYKSRQGNKTQCRCDGSRIVPAPKGYSEVIRYNNIEEDFADYLKWVEQDHKDIPDERLKEYPNGVFIGTWRNARWHDEAQRRNLI